jgi:hypothetical protein
MNTDTRNAFQRIADVLAEHLNIRLGDVSDVSTAEEFAKLFEVAAMNYSAARRKAEREDYDDTDADDTLEQRAAAAMRD